MTAKDAFSYQPVPSAPSETVAEAVPTNPNPYKSDEDERPSDAAIMVSCGLLGMVVGGPFLAILTAIGGRWVADRQSPIGDSTRAFGRIAASVGKKAREEDLWCKVKAAVRSLCNENCNCRLKTCTER